MEKNEIVSKDVESMYEEISQLKTEVEKNQHDFAVKFLNINYN